MLTITNNSTDSLLDYVNDMIESDDSFTGVVDVSEEIRYLDLLKEQDHLNHKEKASLKNKLRTAEDLNEKLLGILAVHGLDRNGQRIRKIRKTPDSAKRDTDSEPEIRRSASSSFDSLVDSANSVPSVSTKRANQPRKRLSIPINVFTVDSVNIPPNSQQQLQNDANKQVNFANNAQKDPLSSPFSDTASYNTATTYYTSSSYSPSSPEPNSPPQIQESPTQATAPQFTQQDFETTNNSPRKSSISFSPRFPSKYQTTICTQTFDSAFIKNAPTQTDESSIQQKSANTIQQSPITTSATTTLTTSAASSSSCDFLFSTTSAETIPSPVTIKPELLQHQVKFPSPYIKNQNTLQDTATDPVNNQNQIQQPEKEQEQEALSSSSSFAQERTIYRNRTPQKQPKPQQQLAQNRQIENDRTNENIDRDNQQRIKYKAIPVYNKDEKQQQKQSQQRKDEKQNERKRRSKKENREPRGQKNDFARQERRKPAIVQQQQQQQPINQNNDFVNFNSQLTRIENSLQRIIDKEDPPPITGFNVDIYDMENSRHHHRRHRKAQPETRHRHVCQPSRRAHSSARSISSSSTTTTTDGSYYDDYDYSSDDSYYSQYSGSTYGSTSSYTTSTTSSSSSVNPTTISYIDDAVVVSLPRRSSHRRSRSTRNSRRHRRHQRRDSISSSSSDSLTEISSFDSSSIDYSLASQYTQYSDYSDYDYDYYDYDNSSDFELDLPDRRVKEILKRHNIRPSLSRRCDYSDSIKKEARRKDSKTILNEFENYTRQKMLEMDKLAHKINDCPEEHKKYGDEEALLRENLRIIEACLLGHKDHQRIFNYIKNTQSTFLSSYYNFGWRAACNLIEHVVHQMSCGF